MTAHQSLQRSVCVVINQNIHVTNALHKMQNVSSAIKRDTIVACVVSPITILQTTEPAETSDSDSKENFLGTVESQQETYWITLLKVNDMEVNWHWCWSFSNNDSEATFKNLEDVQLKKPTRSLYGPAISPLTILTQFTINLTFKHVTCKQTVFVVKNLKNNLLELPAITSLNLISRIDSIHCSADEVKKLYLHLFQGLGSLGEEYEIKLKENAKPFSLHTARNVSLPLRSKVQRQMCHIPSDPAITMVLRYGGCPKAAWTSEDLCRFETSKWNVFRENFIH